MVTKDFPCKTCGHAADRHYVNISGDEEVCVTCAKNNASIDIGEEYHSFVGDNLKYMELQIKRQELRGE